MKNSLKIKRLVGIASLAAVVIVLQLIATYLPFTKLFGGTISITLALIPIVVGAILYGPAGGAILGAVMGVMVIVDPSTLSVFMPHNPAATIILCLLKSAAAGAVSGLLFKVLYKKNFVLAVVLAAVSVPVINTGLFTIGAVLFFSDIYGAQGFSAFGVIIGLIWVNFLIEMAVNSILSPAVLQIVRVTSRNYNIGCTFDLEEKEIEIENTEEVLD